MTTPNINRWLGNRGMNPNTARLTADDSAYYLLGDERINLMCSRLTHPQIRDLIERLKAIPGDELPRAIQVFEAAVLPPSAPADPDPVPAPPAPQAPRPSNGPLTYQAIADEIAASYPVDQARIDRALDILRHHSGTKVRRATRDENNHPIEPSDSLWIVRSSGGNGWYYVRPSQKSCTCTDHARGHVCKHRIAVYIYTEYERRLYTGIDPRFFTRQAVAVPQS